MEEGHEQAPEPNKIAGWMLIATGVFLVLLIGAIVRGNSIATEQIVSVPESGELEESPLAKVLAEARSKRVKEEWSTFYSIKSMSERVAQRYRTTQSDVLAYGFPRASDGGPCKISIDNPDSPTNQALTAQWCSTEFLEALTTLDSAAEGIDQPTIGFQEAMGIYYRARAQGNTADGARQFVAASAVGRKP